MKKNFYHFFLVFTLMMSLLQVVHAGDITFASGKNDLRYQPLPYSHLTVNATLGKIEFREVMTKLGPFTELYIPGYCHSSVVGDPDLPTFGKLIEIPVNATPEISITRQDYIDLDLSTYAIHTRLIPTQASVSKGITDPSQIPFVLNDATYQLNRFTGAPLVQINPAGTLRTLNLVQLQISPVQYNPVTNQLRVYTALEFK
ncbi:MAG TPA: C25 family peptidase propeptide domain-containing protein, partial [Bacteroidales bacterium]|nr:C25 family peptidase propeptide domain-containing protein [Bacteroidales bacterium]